MSLYDKASLVQIPSGTKDGTLYSVLPANGDGDFTHARASSATRVNKDGLIENVSSGVPRLDYPLLDGVVQSCPALLLESIRTNDIQRSEELDNAYWTKYDTSVSANQIVSPDGNTTADKIIEDTGTSTHIIGRSFSFASGTTYSVSVFAKYNGRNLKLTAGNTATWAGSVKFDLQNGLVISEASGSGSMESYGNDWYRCTVVGTAGATASTNINFQLLDGETESYTGDGTSGVYLWGAMRESGSYPTSYIPTSGSTVTRLTEVCNDAGTVSDFNSVQGVLFADLETVKTSGSRVSLSQAADPFAERVSIDFNTPTNIRFFVEASDDNNTFGVPVNTVQERFKIAVKWNGVNISVFIDGFEAATSTFTGFTADTLDRLQMTAANGVGSVFEGYIYQLMTFSEALTDSELEQITSYRSFDEMAKGQLYTIE